VATLSGPSPLVGAERGLAHQQCQRERRQPGQAGEQPAGAVGDGVQAGQRTIGEQADRGDRDQGGEVLTLIGGGRSNTEIAADLVISVATVKAYVTRLLAKLDARDRVQLVIIAYEAGLASPSR
jgi:DNA-binding CsgD family transcriptional regulator